MDVLEHFGLRFDPFGPADAESGFGVSPTVRTAHQEVTEAVSRSELLIVVLGAAGMGKTLLLEGLCRSYRADEVAVQYIRRGDLAHKSLGAKTDIILIDEGDSLTDSSIAGIAPGTASAVAPVTIMAATRPLLHRLATGVRAIVVTLQPLRWAEAQEFLTLRAKAAGRHDLFTPDALGTLVAAGKGSPRALRVLAGAALFQAASDGAERIASRHANAAALMHGELLRQMQPEVATPTAANDPESAPPRTPKSTGQVAPLRRRRDGALPFAASVAMGALILPILFQSEPSIAPQTAGRAIAAEAVQVPLRLASQAFRVAPAQAAAVPSKPLAPLFSGAPVPERMQPSVAVSNPALELTSVSRSGRSIVPDLWRRPIDPPVVHTSAVIDRQGRVLLDLVSATRTQPAGVADRTQGEAAEPETPGTAGRPALLPGEPMTSPAEFVVAAVRQAPVAAPARTEVVALVQHGVEPTKSLREAARQAAVAKQVVEQTRIAKEAVEQTGAAKETSRQAQAAREAADQAKATKEAAKAATAIKASAEEAKAAKVAADTAKAAREAAEQAKATAAQVADAKLAADQAKAAKDAADAAKAAKDASDQAKAAKEAAEQAKAAKEAAEQAKAAKDAAEQAKAAKEAAESAKAAKEASEQAKAVKGTVEQAKAAKEAAKAAKDSKDVVKGALKPGN